MSLLELVVDYQCPHFKEARMKGFPGPTLKAWGFPKDINLGEAIPETRCNNVGNVNHVGLLSITIWFSCNFFIYWHFHAVKVPRGRPELLKLTCTAYHSMLTSQDILWNSMAGVTRRFRKSLSYMLKQVFIHWYVFFVPYMQFAYPTLNEQRFGTASSLALV